ncbi:MAG: sugar transferase [Firmicutes bacterium]|nr:sugar transferase [Bacillota bacterium]
MKRLFDIVVSIIGLIILSPVFLVIAIMIKLDSNGPVFYRGERAGRNGKIFRIYKFRSMVVDAEKAGGSSTSDGDPRVTRVGAKIRKYKLDELPQLINVLLGDMSLVGPRPQVKWAVEQYNEAEKKLLALRPGITDWASIKFRNEGEIIAKSGIADPDEAYLKLIHPEKMRLELKYLEERSFWVDLKIIFQTISSIMGARNLNE